MTGYTNILRETPMLDGSARVQWSVLSQETTCAWAASGFWAAWMVIKTITLFE